MKKFYFLFFLPPIFIVSCKSIRQKPFQLVKISTDKDIEIVAVGDSNSAAKLYKNVRGLYLVKRSLRPLSIKLQTANRQTNMDLKPARWYAGLFAPGLQAYPSKVFIGREDTSLYLSRYPQERKGRFRYYIAPVLLNNFSLQSPLGQYKNAVGILGLENGFDYFTRHNRYLSVFVGLSTNTIPFQSFSLYYTGETLLQNGSTIYTGIRNNYVLGRFDWGYGLSFNYFNYKYESMDSTYHSGTLNSFGMGASFVAQFRLNNVVRLGVTYQPSIIDFKTAPLFNYQHFLSVNLIIKTGTHKKQRIRQEYYSEY